MNTIIFLIIALALPIALTIFIYFKTKLNIGIFILGLLTFFISQILIRIPILSYIAYLGFSYDNTLLKQVLLALSAGLVEVGADYIAFRFLIKKNTLGKSIVVGLAHGFCENITLVALPVVISLINGNFINISYLGSFERLFALLAHVAFALFAFYAVKHKNLIYLIIGIILHGFSDLLIFILPNIFTIEIGAAIVAILSFITIIYIISKDTKINEYDDINLFS